MRALYALADAGVAFILVGGLAAVAQGVPLVTHDIDIVPSLDPANLDRLFACLTRLNARLRGRPGAPVAPARHHLGPGHLLLVTDQGWLDVLGTLVGGRTYERLLEASVPLELEGRSILVLDLAEIRAIKAELGSPRDQAHLLLIDETLARR